MRTGTHPDPSGHPSKEGMLRLRPSGLRSARPGILSVAQAKSKEVAGWVCPGSAAPHVWRALHPGKGRHTLLWGRVGQVSLPSHTWCM